MAKKKNSKPLKIAKVPKFATGGQKFGEYAGNAGATLLGIAGGAIGMDGIEDTLYRGDSADQFKTVADTTGAITSAGASAVMNAFIPGSGMIVSGGQKALGAVDNGIARNNQAIDPQTGKPYVTNGTANALGQGLGQTGGAVTSMLMARNGGIMKYPDGGAVKVLTPPSNYRFAREEGNRTFYNREADKPISGGTPDDNWEDSIIKRLQSGISPEELVRSKHIGPSSMEKFRPYYKELYTEKESRLVNEPEPKLSEKSSIGGVPWTGERVERQYQNQQAPIKDKEGQVYNLRRYEIPGQYNDKTSSFDTGAGWSKPSVVEGYYDKDKKFVSFTPSSSKLAYDDKGSPYYDANNLARNAAYSLGDEQKLMNQGAVRMVGDQQNVEAVSNGNIKYNQTGDVREKLNTQMGVDPTKGVNNAVPKQRLGGYINNPEAGITSNQHVYENYKTKTNGMMVYPNGGMNMQPNAEIELTEGTKDGNVIREHDLNSHENATAENQKYLNPGTKILSTKLKNPITGKPFSDETIDTKKFEKVINNRKSTPLAIEAAKLNIVGAKAAFEKSYQAQEAYKQFKVQNYAKRMGMDINNIATGNNTAIARNGGIMKYTLGGKNPYGEPGAVLTTDDGRQVMANNEYNTYASNAALPSYLQKPAEPRYTGPTDEGEEIPAAYDQRNTDVGDPTENFNKPVFNAGSPEEKAYNKTLGNKVPWNMLATQGALGIANNIGNIYDLERANKVENTTYNRVAPNYINADFTPNANQYRDAKGAAREFSGGNASTALAAMQSARQQKRDMDTNTRITADNMNAEIGNRANYYNAGIGDRETETNMMNRAASRNIKSNAYANIGQNIMGQYGDYQKGQRDQQMLKILPEMYNDPKFKEFLANNYNV